MIGGNPLLGYVKAYKPEMKMREYELYRGIYCSLCRSLGRNYSPLAQLFLSYDFTLAAVMRLAASESGCTFTRKRCPYNPAKKCLGCEKKDIIDACAHAVIITVYYKIIDNIADSKGFKKLAALLLYPLVSLMHLKAKRLAPEAEKAVSRCMDEQRRAESKKEVGTDEAAQPSAEALAEIFSMGYEGEKAEKARIIGYMVGRYIYILDAADDLADDIKSGSFNMFKREYGNISDKKTRDEFVQRVRGMLNLTQSAALEAFDSMGEMRFHPIINNILADGLTASAQAVLAKYGEKSSKVKTFTVK